MMLSGGDVAWIMLTGLERTIFNLRGRAVGANHNYTMLLHEKERLFNLLALLTNASELHRMEKEIFDRNTIARIKATGAFGEIKRCCDIDQIPLHYEVWNYDEKGDIVITCFDHEMLEWEWIPPWDLPYESRTEEELRDLKILAEIIVYNLLEDPKLESKAFKNSKGLTNPRKEIERFPKVVNRQPNLTQ